MMSLILKSPQKLLKLTRSITKHTTNYKFCSQVDTNVIAENLGARDKATKDLDYQEQALKFEREWKKLTEAANEKQTTAVKDQLTDGQKKKIDLLVQATLELNMFELRYFVSQIRHRIQRTQAINPMKLNLDWPSLKQLEDGTWPPANPNWFAQQEAMAKLWPMGMQNFSTAFGGVFGAPGGAPVGGAAATGAQAQKEEAPKADEKKEEKKAEKSNFDIELTAIDAAQKIKIIKEVRQLLNLGLKEAKEMVERAPVVLKKEVKKEEADKLKQVLAAVGCTVTLL